MKEKDIGGEEKNRKERMRKEDINLRGGKKDEKMKKREMEDLRKGKYRHERINIQGVPF